MNHDAHLVGSRPRAAGRRAGSNSVLAGGQVGGD